MRTYRILAAAATIASLFVCNSASAYERWINVINNGDVTVREVHISHVDDPRFGPDLLGEYLLQPGHQIEVEPLNPQGYCLFDVEIVYVNGTSDIFLAVNLCEETELWI
ncbi:hypothetical protein GHK33_02500 [Sinorhizobium meliloti]|uniref:hypothetical protein n=1 Tax=Rhizobium meliloti TaxID=382 RepID=UPI000FD8FED9|nr:hypothetical protein [Sinorhizobium meliloti]MQW61604.1 hypothetical protein [Sinorhizobium meliloti]RVP09562.1 hypothetical protein CN085_28315 [Sinorhizobium meliloti]